MAITKLKALGVTDGTLTNTQINASAAIAKTKLAALDIVNADVNASAAIAKTKLAALDIVNADVNASAAIARTKFAAPLCVYAGSNVDNGGYAAGAWEGIPYDTEVVDTHSAFVGEESTNTNTAGVFTAPFAGKFLLIAGLKFMTTTTSNLAHGEIRIVKNTTGDATDGGTAIHGTEVGHIIANSVATKLSGTTSAVLDLASGNKVWCEAYANWWGGAWRASDGYFSLMQIG